MTDTTSRTILPGGWPRPKGYSNGVVARGELLAIAGMIGWDVREKLVSAAFAPQFRQALANVLAVGRQRSADPRHAGPRAAGARRRTWRRFVVRGRRHGDCHGRGSLASDEGVAVDVRHAVIETVVAHARREAPLECCGLLVGGSGGIEEAVPARNELASPARYRIDPADHFALIRRLRGTPHQIVGAYHSHPASAPVPSETDVAQAYYSDFVWLIVSLVNTSEPDVRLFQIAGGTWREITLRHRP
jgi:proteasome lid subunit RPN8/RPN11